jgi:hypothetical protein
MAEKGASAQSGSKALEAIVEAAKKAFDPSTPQSSRESGLQDYNGLIERYDAASASAFGPAPFI